MSKVTLFHHGTAPNPPKVAILLEELNVSYNLVKKEFGDGANGVKHPDFLKINPNGRVPAIIDHTNNDKVVWESAAILLYLAERFDNSGKYNGKNLDEKAIVWEWLTFQASGHGPMQGQVNYFKYIHPVKNLDESVIARFKTETYRVWGVLEKRLENGRQFIALDRFTIADMAFYPWLKAAPYGDLTFEKFPLLDAYVKRIDEIPSVKEAYRKLKEAT